MLSNTLVLILSNYRECIVDIPPNKFAPFYPVDTLMHEKGNMHKKLDIKLYSLRINKHISLSYTNISIIHDKKRAKPSRGAEHLPFVSVIIISYSILLHIL